MQKCDRTLDLVQGREPKKTADGAAKQGER